MNRLTIPLLVTALVLAGYIALAESRRRSLECAYAQQRRVAAMYELWWKREQLTLAELRVDIGVPLTRDYLYDLNTWAVEAEARYDSVDAVIAEGCGAGQ